MVKEDENMKEPGELDWGNKEQEVYDWLMDDESRMIFENRYNWYEKRDYDYLRKMLKNLGVTIQGKNKDKRTILDFMTEDSKENKQKIIIFAAGVAGQFLRLHLGWWNIEVAAFCDNNQALWGKTVKDLLVISPEEMKKQYPNAKILISSNLWQDEITRQLQELGYAGEQIYFPCDSGAIEFEGQYFDPEIMIPGKNEFFLDCGCLNMGSSLEFAEWCYNQYAHIICFEPDKDNFLECQRIKDSCALPDIELVNRGVWNEKTFLKFNNLNAGSSAISENGETTIETTCIDDYIRENGLADQTVTFIKMDIEGAELEALIGAKETICKDKPRLAISIYHSREHLTALPRYIKSLVPEYRLYLRHYSCTSSETVLYAVV